MYEDLDDAKEAIQARDADQLQASGYFDDLIRWMEESKNKICQKSLENAENLKDAMFQYSVNNKESAIPEIMESTEELAIDVSDAITRLKLIQRILWKIEESSIAKNYYENQ